MSAQSHSHSVVPNPGPLKNVSSLKTISLAVAAGGAACFVILLMAQPERAWSVFLMNHFYFMSLALGGLFFTVLQHLVGAMWSAPIRRIAESFTAYLPIAFATMIVLFLGGLHQLYHWTHLEAVQNDPILLGKSGYLNEKFFWIRNLFIFSILIGFAKFFVGNSVQQDDDTNYIWTKRSRKLAPVFMMVFGVGFTVMSFDQIMSLDPHWFSTIFGIYTFAGLFYSSLAMLALVAAILKEKGVLAGLVNENHFHDLGKFMFAFTVFWAYIAFSQFMLIWYANLPEETGYYLKRMDSGWMNVSVFLLVGKFVAPFLLLIKRGAKRNHKWLAMVAIWMLFCQWMDVLWMVRPEIFADGPNISFLEVGISFGFLGVFVFSFIHFLSKKNIVAIRDPRLSESVYSHKVF